jgi:RimJ/RimL family protein N-acetyltransferase
MSRPDLALVQPAGGPDSPSAQGHPAPQAGLSRLSGVSLRDDTIVLGPVLPEDMAALFVWLNDVDAAGMDLAFRPTDWMTFGAWLADFGKNPAQVLFAIRRLNHPRPIGIVFLTKIQAVHRSVEVGVRIGDSADRGKGLGRRAIRLALRYAFDHLNLDRVQLSVFKSNAFALRAYAAAGFEHEGMLRRAAFVQGRWEDVVIMGALRR